jgi:hypothetical protein
MIFKHTKLSNAPNISISTMEYSEKETLLSRKSSILKAPLNLSTYPN